MKDRIHPGMRLRAQGKATLFGYVVRLSNPNWEVLPLEGDEPGARGLRFLPVYPASEACGSMQIETAVRAVLERALPRVEDHFGAEHLLTADLPGLARAYGLIHAPESPEQWESGRRRLAYDELFLLQLGVALKRQERGPGGGVQAPALRWGAVLDRRIRARFPFEFTPDQEGVIKEVVADLRGDRPANRLIQGDVGSGKTVVAMYALLMAVANGMQGAIMAPTELLAEQHFGTLSRALQGSEVRVALLSGSGTVAARREVKAKLASGEVDLVVGTHALLTKDVAFRSLAVAVVDEQHRFGVHQRAGLRGKAGGGRSPHMLVMTATPIPRTLALTLFGDLDVSSIRALPPGRKPIKTRVVSPGVVGEVYPWVNERLTKGEQAYIVAPAISVGENPDDEFGSLTSVTELHDRLRDGPLRGRRLAVLHGQMPHAAREEVMARFRAGEVDALVATTVIEVGVDVPNATLMVVEHAERFGLAQLHQLRGRVGRGTRPSACILIGAPVTPEAERRLAVMATTLDGFQLAEKDLEIRGFGDVLGTRQAGMPPFRVADLPRDLELLTLARRDAFAWIARSPTLMRPEERLLRRRLLNAHGAWLDLADVG
ncbi:MAG: ATP-dependent DNA helicase RecG [Phycisphaerales bacterium]